MKAVCSCGARAAGMGRNVLKFMQMHKCSADTVEVVESVSQNQIGFVPNYSEEFPDEE